MVEDRAGVRTGVGGWVFAEWRGGAFYPEGLRQADELGYASRKLGAIEINATFYRTQSEKSFAAWAAAVPDDFMFTLKAPRGVVMKRTLAETGEGVAWFLRSGLERLGSKLGPINWQLPGHKRFEREDIAGFLRLLPANLGSLTLRHALEARHESFADPVAAALLAEWNVALILAESPSYPRLDADTADFRYARLMITRDEEAHGCAEPELARLAAMARGWDKPGFVFFIDGAKAKNPAAAMALHARLEAR
jgi:uncharacterized protein YecE (DUF72 family)